MSWPIVAKHREQGDKQKFGLSNAYMVSLWTNVVANQREKKELFCAMLSVGLFLCNVSSVQNSVEHRGGFAMFLLMVLDEGGGLPLGR